MLPTREFFKKIECPYYNFTIKGSCNRPHCHFKHSRRDADYDFAEPIVEQISEEIENNEPLDEEESEDEIENPPPPQSTTTLDLNVNKDCEDKVVENEEEKEEEEEEEDLEEQSEEENEEDDDEENLLRFKKGLMNSIKKLLEMYPKLFSKNINTNDFNHLVDEFIKNLLNYEELELVETKKVTYNPTPIVELKKQEKRIKTQLPYIPECVKAPVAADTLDIDSDLKFLEDLIQNDSLFAAGNKNEPISNDVEPTKNEQNEDKARNKEKSEGSKEKSSGRDKSKSSHSRGHDLNSHSKDRSSSKEKSSSKDDKISSKEVRLNSSKDKHRSSSHSHKSSSSSKNSSSHSSSSSRSKHSSSRKRSRNSSSSRNHSDSKRSKHSSSSHKKSESSTIVISSESSDDDEYDYSNMNVVDDEDNGENLVSNDNTSPKDEKAKTEDYDEPDYIRKKKKQRIAHIDIFGVPSNPAPVSNRAKVLNPNDRFKQIQEKYKGLNRNANSHNTSDTSSVKISHVPNVPSMLTAKKTITPAAPNKNSLLMNDILKRTELNKTIAQTSKKNNRVAHVPSVGATATKPMIQVDTKGTRIPLVIRQTCLDRIFALYSKYVPPDLASDRAVQVEIETYEKCHATKSYQNSIANSILRIRKEQSGFFMGSKPQLR